MLVVRVSFAFYFGLEAKRPYVSMKIFSLIERHLLRNSFHFLLNCQLSFFWTLATKNARTKVLCVATRNRTRDHQIFCLTIPTNLSWLQNFNAFWRIQQFCPVLRENFALLVGVKAMCPYVAFESFDCLRSRWFWSVLSVAFECSKFSSSFQWFVRNPVGTLEPDWIQPARDFQPKFTATELSQLLGYVAYKAGAMYCCL